MILPIRNLGNVGLVTDASPYALPIEAFTAAVNVRFDEQKVSRAPVFRDVKSGLANEPRLCMGVPQDTGYDRVIIVGENWALDEYGAGSITNINGTLPYSTTTDPRPFTGVVLADVVYINRPDRVPAYRLPTGGNFQELPEWNSDWRCEALRSFGDFMVALNMTEGATNYPNRVRFSDIVQANAVPQSWDEADVTKSAGFNDLVQMQTPIVDGAQLGANFIVYSSTEIMQMEFVGGTFLFNFRQLFSDAGVINANCVAEVDGQHYVFGTHDIYTHDGTTKQSLCDERTRAFIYNGLNVSKSDVCFTYHNRALNEVYFCYHSGDQYTSFKSGGTLTRCNRAAVYNYKNNTWALLDLPNISAAGAASIETVLTYNNAEHTNYESIGGSYYDQQDGFHDHVIMVGSADSTAALSSHKLYGLDLADSGTLAFNYDPEANKEAFVERVGIDLDEASQPLSGYKVVTAIYPQVSTDNTDDKIIQFAFGASDTPNQAPNYSQDANFNIETDYKIDVRAAGRYISYKLKVTGNRDFSFTGFDMDVKSTGRR